MPVLKKDRKGISAHLDDMVEVAGIEPASFGAKSGLLRAQSAVAFLGPGGHADKSADRPSHCEISRLVP